jgi:hypothetical protein
MQWYLVFCTTELFPINSLSYTVQGTSIQCYQYRALLRYYPANTRRASHHVAWSMTVSRIWHIFEGWKMSRAERVSTNDKTERSVYYVGTAIAVQAWTGPDGSGRLRLAGFLDFQHIKVVRLSALRTSHLYPPANIPGSHFCYRLSQPQSHSVVGSIVNEKFQWHHRESYPWPSSL